jgi:hypothetical protein
MAVGVIQFECHRIILCAIYVLKVSGRQLQNRKDKIE